MVQSWVCRSITCKPACTQHAENTAFRPLAAPTTPLSTCLRLGLLVSVRCQHLQPAFAMSNMLPQLARLCHVSGYNSCDMRQCYSLTCLPPQHMSLLRGRSQLLCLLAC